MNVYKDRILDIISRSETPIDVEKIKEYAGIGNWNTCLKHCLELLIAGKIQGVKSSKSWIFWLHNTKVAINQDQMPEREVHVHAKSPES